LYFAGEWLVKSLMRIARFLGWREFVVAFFIMAFATSMPNLFVGISSTLHKIPQLSFADVVGANVVDLTLAIALATLIAKGLPAESRLIQNSAIFTISIAILPLLLILDGTLGRGDGIILILVFLFYIAWLFSKEERFKKVYDGEVSGVREFKTFFKDLGMAIFGVLILLVSAEGIVRSAAFFAESLRVPLAFIGILIVGLGTSLPEIYFSAVSARKKENWLILGNLMGSVIIVTTLVLGIVSFISPIKIIDFSPFVIARFFLIVSALFFFFFVRTGQKITKKEALFLLGIYITFVLVEILTK
jgi:cation:H+ antiporter